MSYECAFFSTQHIFALHDSWLYLSVFDFSLLGQLMLLMWDNDGDAVDGLWGETREDRSELLWPQKEIHHRLTIIEILYQNTFSQASLTINPSLIQTNLEL